MERPHSPINIHLAPLLFAKLNSAEKKSFIQVIRLSKCSTYPKHIQSTRASPFRSLADLKGPYTPALLYSYLMLKLTDCVSDFQVTDRTETKISVMSERQCGS